MSRRVLEHLAAFIACEERENLFERAILGVQYWPLIRHDVYRETLEALGLASPAHLRLEQLPLAHWLGPQLRQLARTVPRSLWTALPRADMLVAAHPRHIAHEGRFVCPYTQPLLWSTPHSRVVLEGHFQGRYFAPDAGERTRYVDLALALSHAEFRLRELRGHGLSQRELHELDGVRAALARSLGGAPPSAAIARRARTAVLATLGLTPRFARLLDRVRPRLVLNVVGYRLVNQILTELAHRRGIPVAELQHGTMGNGHAAYNFAPGRRPNSFPDHLLLFGELWRGETPGLPLPPERTPAIGYAWLELQRASLAKLSRARDPNRRRVLFLSQRGIGRELSRIAAALARELPHERFALTYRLHPSEGHAWREAYPELAASGIAVETADQRSLYAALCQADVQVGVYSTSLIEGVAFGLATILVELPGHEQLSLLSDHGLAEKVANAGALSAALRRAPPPLAAGEQLWSRGAIQKFGHFLATQLG